MLKKISVVLLVSILMIEASIAQSNHSLEVTNWGDGVSGMQMCINLNTNVVAAGSETKLQGWIKNSSTNSVFVIFIYRETAPALYLTNRSGKFYDLTPRSGIPMPVIGGYGDKVNAEEIYTWSASVKISQEVEPGEYELKVERYFILTSGLKEGGKIVSNSVKLKVVN